jgi:hypothetical protein
MDELTNISFGRLVNWMPGIVILGFAFTIRLLLLWKKSICVPGKLFGVILLCGMLPPCFYQFGEFTIDLTPIQIVPVFCVAFCLFKIWKDEMIWLSSNVEQERFLVELGNQGLHHGFGVSKSWLFVPAIVTFRDCRLGIQLYREWLECD